MPQARGGGGSKSGGSRSTRSQGQRGKGARSATARSGSARAGSASARASSGSARATGSRPSASRAKSGRAGARATRTGSAAGGADARVEAAARRLRKLNERIIDAGREAGESTLSSYERVLKSIASTIERGPGSSDIEWVSNLATAQARFIRDLASSWTSAARKVLR